MVGLLPQYLSPKYHITGCISNLIIVFIGYTHVSIFTMVSTVEVVVHFDGKNISMVRMATVSSIGVYKFI